MAYSHKSTAAPTDESYAPLHASFTAPRDRDAWSTIRGFVFQADLTIVRWLSLDPNQELYLECGEDIDTVSGFLQSGDEARLLEQVKHRDKNITLKSSGALSAVANAIEHRRANPDQTLLFRFTTNARAGKEQLSPFLGKLTGISAWQRLRSRSVDEVPLPDEEAAMLASGIRKILSGAKCPDDLPEEIWLHLLDFFQSADAETFHSFIRDFEWSLSAPEAEDMSDRIQEKLQEKGWAPDALTAHTQYQRLFLFVLKTLSRRTGKQLTVLALEEVLNQPLSESDQAFFESFLSQMGLLDRKLSFLQAQMGRQEQILSAVADQVNRIFDLSQVQALTPGTPIPIFEIPPVEENVAPRAQAVDSLAYELSTAFWLALTGSSGMGKSYLTLLLALQNGNCPTWLRFRSMDSTQAAAALDTVFLSLSGGEVPSNRREWYARICRTFGAGALIVLDDLPLMIGGDALAQRLELLVLACQDAGTRLITTSVNTLPGSLQRAARGYLSQKSVPPLNELDAAHILRGFGAPSKLLEDLPRVRMLNNVSRGHPTLLTAVATYLRERNWGWSDQQLGDLIQARFADEVNDETIHRLLLTVADEQSRAMLYRLNLIIGPIDTETARLLAAVEPSVSQPRERLATLTGLWMQRDTRDTWRLSPLISVLGSEDLSGEVKQKCHSILARQILRKGSLTTADLTTAITYLAVAQEYEEAVLLLVWSLAQIHASLEKGEITKHQAKQSGLLMVFWGTPLPNIVTLNSQLLLRAYQIYIGTDTDSDVSYATSALSQLISQAGDTEETGLLAAASLAVPQLAEHDFEASCRCLVKTMKVFTQVVQPDPHPLQLPPGFTPGSFLWLNLAGIRSKVQVLRWLDMLGQASTEVRDQVLTDPNFADQGLFLLMDRFWLNEARKPVPEQDWERVLADMDEIENAAALTGAEFLQATAIRAKILILCEHIKSIDQALAVAREGLARLSDDPRVVFTVCDALGRKLTYVPEREGEAEVWLRQAEEACNQLPHRLRWEQSQTLLALARLADNRGAADEAVSLLSHAAVLVRSAEFCPEIELVKLEGDLAIGRWKQGDEKGAFQELDDAAQRLVKLKENTENWKALFSVLGHTVGYMAAHARRMPLVIESGEPYVLPPVGNFNDPKESELAAMYQPERDLILPSLLARFALAVGQDERASYWVNQTLEMGKETPAAALVLATTIIEIGPYLVHNERFAEFFDGVRESTFVLKAAWLTFQQGSDTLLSEVDVEKVLGKHNGANWAEAETATLGSVLIPLALHFAVLALRSPYDAETAKHLLQNVQVSARLCRETAAVSIRPESWRKASFLLKSCFLNYLPLGKIIDKANSYTAADAALKAVTYIGAKFGPDVDLKEACRAQMAFLPYCLQFLPTEASHRLLLIPFLEEFWGRALSERDASFAAAEHEFHKACKAPLMLKARCIMQSVTDSLGIWDEAVIQSAFTRWDAREEKRRSFADRSAH